MISSGKFESKLNHSTRCNWKRWQFVQSSVCQYADHSSDELMTLSESVMEKNILYKIQRIKEVYLQSYWQHYCRKNIFRMLGRYVSIDAYTHTHARKHSDIFDLFLSSSLCHIIYAIDDTLLWFVHTITLIDVSWWRHQMETFSALLAICAGNSPVSGQFPAQRPVTRSFDIFLDLSLNKRLSKQSWGWWFAIAPIMMSV